MIIKHLQDMASITIDVFGDIERVDVLSGYPTLISLNGRTSIAIETCSGIQLKILDTEEHDNSATLTRELERQIRQRIDDVKHLRKVHAKDTIQLLRINPNRLHSEIIHDMDINSQIMRNHVDILETTHRAPPRITRTINTATRGKVYNLQYGVSYSIGVSVLQVSKYTLDETVDLDLPENHEVINTETITTEEIYVHFSQEIKSELSAIINTHN